MTRAHPTIGGFILPFTGAPLPGLLLVAGLALLLGGGLVVVARRRCHEG